MYAPLSNTQPQYLQSIGYSNQNLNTLNSTNTQRKLQLTSSTDITSSGDVDKNPVHSSTTHGKRPHLPIASPLIREFIHEMEGHEELSQKRKMAPSTEDGESGGEKKVAKRICSHEGCTNLAYRRGVCASHGARPKCSGEGCTNYAKKGGLCARHGGKYTPKICGREGCTNNVVKAGVCKRHGAKVTVAPHKKCNQEGCANGAVQGGVCQRHGAKVKKCSQDGCMNNAQRGGVCIRHGAPSVHKKCSHEGCSNQVANGGVCVSHGAEVKKCSHDGCASNLHGHRFWEYTFPHV